MQTPKLDRNQSHEINAHQADQLYLWDSPFQSDRQNLTLRDNGGKDVLTVYAITCDQLAELYLDIGNTLGKSPDPTIHHLQQMHDRIGALITTAKSTPEEEPECIDPATFE